MDENASLKLKDMISHDNIEDVTNDIRQRKHSDKIKNDVEMMSKLKKLHNMTQPISPDNENILIAGCSFLYTNYTDIFIKLKKDEFDLEMFDYFLMILKRIEECEIDQHTGAYEVGKVLKNIYVDSALRMGEKDDESRDAPVDIIDISWKEFKNKIE
uniref:Uncharacterized protein n=1 Tax=viral metagenome TaxID=1070528 RepID=A0A6C0BSJ0_9ZZZZ